MASQPQVLLVPPFTRESAAQKVRKAEDNWNSRDPQRVALGYTVDCRWRNRAEFVNGREEIIQFLTRKWNRELEYRLIKELWAFDGARIAVRFAYESHDDSGQWFRSYGNENWEFNAEGVMHHRYACINDLPIKPADRLFHWPLGAPRGSSGTQRSGSVTRLAFANNTNQCNAARSGTRGGDYFLAEVAGAFASVAAISARNFAACSGCFIPSYSSARSLRAFISQLTFGSIRGLKIS